MKILGLTRMDSGCGYHRVVLPMACMDDIEGYITNVPTPEIIEQQWDIVLFNRFSPFDNDLDYFRRKMGAKVVMDLDDDWVLPKSHLNYQHYIQQQQRIENNIRNADLIICTNELIADRIEDFNPRIEIIENGIPFGFDQFTADRNSSDKVRLFWAGSITHENDIAILRNPIKRLVGENIQMVIGGYNDSNTASKQIWDRMLSAFTAGGNIDHIKGKAELPNMYMNLYKDADVMLIPLERSYWHAAKSNLKILEAASKKIPVIVSQVEPYTRDPDVPVNWVKSQGDWYKHIKTLIKDETKRTEQGEDLYRWAKGKYDLFGINKRRRQAFEDLIKA